MLMFAGEFVPPIPGEEGVPPIAAYPLPVGDGR
jgi:hypothetical protein